MPLPNLGWPYLHVLVRLGLALLVGLLAGLERERRAKEAGMRTFAFAALLGCMGGLLGTPFALAALGMVTTLVVLMNLEHLRQAQAVELTTSAALLLMGFAGILCGLGHTLTPVAVGILATALLAWKTPLNGFSLGLTELELRAAILFALLAFVIYPALPEGAVDPWGAIQPRSAWLTVLLLVGISFVNYVLWKIHGARGVELTGFLGGLVNSTATVAEMADKVRESGGRLAGPAARGIMLATAAMLVRNAVLLLLLAPGVLAVSAAPLGLMLAGSALALGRGRIPDGAPGAQLALGSPFSLASALRFGLVFLVLQVAGVAAHRFLGLAGVYGTAVLGGLVSSASAVAVLGSMAAGNLIPVRLGAQGAVLACMTSALMNLPFLGKSGHPAFMRLTALRTALVLALGLLGLGVQPLLRLGIRRLHHDAVLPLLPDRDRDLAGCRSGPGAGWRSPFSEVARQGHAE